MQISIGNIYPYGVSVRYHYSTPFYVKHKHFAQELRGWIRQPLLLDGSRNKSSIPHRLGKHSGIEERTQLVRYISNVVHLPDLVKGVSDSRDKVWIRVETSAVLLAWIMGFCARIRSREEVHTIVAGISMTTGTVSSSNSGIGTTPSYIPPLHWKASGC